MQKVSNLEKFVIYLRLITLKISWNIIMKKFLGLNPWLKVNSQFANKEKNITNFLACLDIKITFLDIIPKNLQIISLAILLLKRNTEYSKNNLFFLFYHICNINFHTDVDIFKIINKNQLNKDIRNYGFIYIL